MPSSTRTPARPGGAAGETVLIGAPTARRLYREIADAPDAPLLLSVVGVGGSGKTVLLDALAELYAESGVRVCRDLDGPPDAVHLLDDAQLLERPELDRLCAHAAGAGPIRLIVAQRPWPRPAGLAELAALLTRGRAPLLLGDLDRGGVAGRAASLVEGRPPASVVDYVLAETGGLPTLVDQLLAALHGIGLGSGAGLVEVARWLEGRPGPSGREPAGNGALVQGRLGGTVGPEPPAGLLEQLYHRMEAEPEPIRELMLALVLGAPPDAELLAELLEVPADEVAGLAERARAAGLLSEGGTPRPILSRAVLRRGPLVRRTTVRRRLAEVQLRRGGSVLDAARNLLGTGATGARVAEVFETAADELLRAGLAGGDGWSLAGRLLSASVEAGAPALRLAARGAEAAARSGDLDRALELADQVLAEPSSVSEADRARAVSVAAAALAQRGLLARSAELYRWLGVASLGANAVVAVPALIGTGALDEARALLDPPGPPGPAGSGAGFGGAPVRPPTLLAGAEALMATGVYETIVGSPTAALSQLARAAALLEPTGHGVLLPDTPAALAALVAAHCGELDVAQSVLDRAVAAGLGGRTAAARHRLLQAWIAMSRGATGTARGLLDSVDAGLPEAGDPDAGNSGNFGPFGNFGNFGGEVSGAVSTPGSTRVSWPASGPGLASGQPSGPTGGSGIGPAGRLEPRDELVAAALQVGLARRAGDLAALMPAWGRAREAIVRHPVDLYVLQPLGELIIASARLREQAWVRPHLQEAHALLERLGYPVLWSASVYWSELHAALQAENWAEATAQAEALERAASSGSRYAGAMAVAARSWLAVLHGQVDQAAVESAARGLHAVGLSWDGGKLAGQGAIRTTDRKAMTALLQCARGLQSSGQAGESSHQAPAQPSGPPQPAGSAAGRPEPAPARADQEPGSGLEGEPGGALSDREREVAELVLAGLTYKQIGERLFISAKTVEHHVARMRQRLGSNSRGELMAHLRMIVG
ncbi:MAG TPA: LuxR C-terminal-related transcriptional regulator [Pseudonocardia sp.]